MTPHYPEIRQIPYAGIGVNPGSWNSEPDLVRGHNKWFDPRCARALSEYQPLFPRHPEDINYLYNALWLVDQLLYSRLHTGRCKTGSYTPDFESLASEYWSNRSPDMLSIGTGLGIIDFKSHKR